MVVLFFSFVVIVVFFCLSLSLSSVLCCTRDAMLCCADALLCMYICVQCSSVARCDEGCDVDTECDSWLSDVFHCRVNFVTKCKCDAGCDEGCDLLCPRTTHSPSLPAKTKRPTPKPTFSPTNTMCPCGDIWVPGAGACKAARSEQEMQVRSSMLFKSTNFLFSFPLFTRFVTGRLRGVCDGMH